MLQSICHITVEERKIGYSRTEESDDSDWEMEDRGAFDVFEESGSNL